MRVRLKFFDTETGRCLSGAVVVDGAPLFVEARIAGHRGHVAKLNHLPAKRVRVTRTDLAEKTATVEPVAAPVPVDFL